MISLLVDTNQFCVDFIHPVGKGMWCCVAFVRVRSLHQVTWRPGITQNAHPRSLMNGSKETSGLSFLIISAVFEKGNWPCLSWFSQLFCSFWCMMSWCGGCDVQLKVLSSKLLVLLAAKLRCPIHSSNFHIIGGQQQCHRRDCNLPAAHSTSCKGCSTNSSLFHVEPSQLPCFMEFVPMCHHAFGQWTSSRCSHENCIVLNHYYSKDHGRTMQACNGMDCWSGLEREPTQ